MMTDAKLIDIVREEVEIIIMGASDIGKYLYRFLTRLCWKKNIILCDNYHKKQGSIDGYEVFSVEKATELYKKAIYLIASDIYETIMRNQLVELGISEERILLGITKESWDYMIDRRRSFKLQPLKKLQFEVDIASHCNLNCKCCSQFSCIAEEEYIDIEEMERDFKRLGKLFSGEAERIYLIGGEPLLHPQIEECMVIARKYFPKGKISVFTNGLLLPRCSEGFWDICKGNKISIIVTKYPINLDYQEIIDKMGGENVEFEFFGESEDFKYMTNLGLDMEGKQDVESSFLNCWEANNCVKLKNGKLFTCTRPAAIYKFNNFFGKDLKVSEEDYLDIYQVDSKEEILAKMAKPIPFCRYCNKSGKRKAMEWGRTQKDIQEWL